MSSILKTKASPREGKEEQLKTLVHGFKAIGLRANQAELSLLSGLSKRTLATRSKDGTLDSYWNEVSMTPRKDKRYLILRSIEEGLKEKSKLPKGSTITPEVLESLYGVILGTLLRVETNILKDVTSLRSSWEIGAHLARIQKMLSRVKRDDGVPIHSENLSAKYLRSVIELDTLFDRTADYSAGTISKRWKAKELFTKYIKSSNVRLLSSEVLPLFSHLFPSYMSPSEDAKKPYYVVDHNKMYPPLIVSPSEIRRFETNSLFALLIRVIDYDKGKLWIPVRNESEKAEKYEGRSYNVFCALRSHERLALGYISYDMNAAMQSISLQLIGAASEDYPMLWQYTHNKAYKKAVRRQIAQDLGIPIEDVKARLTAFSFGSVKDRRLHKYYEAFQSESDKLRRAVLAYAKEKAPQVFQDAIDQTSREVPACIFWQDLEHEEGYKERKASASIFFFVWTHYERKIREAMLQILDDGLEVHDAVYSKLNVATEDIEDAIFKLTGFRIVIDKDPENPSIPFERIRLGSSLPVEDDLKKRISIYQG